MVSVAEKTPPNDYLAAREKAAFYVVPNLGYLVFSGETRQDYLQRQTTNDLGLLSGSRALPNFLTSASGRILEFFTLLQVGDSIGMLTQPGHGLGLADYFKKRIFFNDKVGVEDKSAEWAAIEIYGPGAQSELGKLGFDRLPKVHEVLQSGDTLAIGNSVPAATLIVMPAAQANTVVASLDAEEMDHETREILRIEAAQPGDIEFNSQYTPFELGLERFVSTEKGCYTGQEVLARQVTYDKIVRRLVQVRSEAAFSPGSALMADGKRVGNATSAAVSPSLGPIALAVVRKPFDRPGIDLQLENGFLGKVQ